MVAKTQALKSNWHLTKNLTFILFFKQVLNFTSVLSDEPLGNMFT